jgi:putative CocE/NonD family hydrolase
MRIKTNFPRVIREIENTWILMSDGARLAARIWLPVDAEQHPVPAILEYIPYRKDDSTAPEDATRHPYLAGHGYASIRVDMRGSGDSDGLLLDEYLPQEQDDALEVIAWIAAQPWCNGAVGMFGISWGGFNSLQVAARRPPALKAILTVCSTDDRYHDDCHYMGGCLLASDMIKWASTMLAYNPRPPDPRFVGERWREMWFNRMEHTPPFIEAWMAHQRRDAFWKHGSVCENYADITCPVYAVGGWADGYTNAIPRLLAHLTVPRKGLIGPWAHAYPEQGVPGPAIGFLQESLRWWDHWLKGIDTGIMNEPMLRVWMQDSVEPSSHYETWPGRWVTESTWPSSNVTARAYTLTSSRTLDDHPASGAASLPFTIHGAQVAGLDAGAWCPYGVPGDMPGDQREDDGLSLCFDSAPLDAPMETLGFPEVSLTVASDRPNALLAVRLCDVAPSGASTLISWGLLNLTHRESHEHPTPLEPGKPYAVTVRLNAIGHRLPARHRWRVAISPTYWPHAWPSPEPVTLSVFPGPNSQLRLPVRTPQPTDADLPPFLSPECAPGLALEMIRSASRTRSLNRDLIGGVCELVDRGDGGCRQFPHGLTYERVGADIYRIVEGDPLSASIRCEKTIKLERGREAWRVRLETSSRLTSDATTFWVTNTLDAYEGNARVFSKTWTLTVPRDQV